MTDELDRMDVPAARRGEAFEGGLPTIRDGSLIEPAWVALSGLQQTTAGHDRLRAASGAAMAGAFVRTMRTTARLTQDQLSKASGIAQSVISDIERGVGKVGPSFETILRLAKACGMEIGFAPMAQTDASGADVSVAVDDVIADPTTEPRSDFADISCLQVHENMRPSLIDKGVGMVMDKRAFELATKRVVIHGGRPRGKASESPFGVKPGKPRPRGKASKSPLGLKPRKRVPGRIRFGQPIQEPLEVAMDEQGLFTVHRPDGSELVLVPIAYREAGAD